MTAGRNVSISWARQQDLSKCFEDFSGIRPAAPVASMAMIDPGHSADLVLHAQILL